MLKSSLNHVSTGNEGHGFSYQTEIIIDLVISKSGHSFEASKRTANGESPLKNLHTNPCCIAYVCIVIKQSRALGRPWPEIILSIG
jgi:hypothetical protein